MTIAIRNAAYFRDLAQWIDRPIQPGMSARERASAFVFGPQVEGRFRPSCVLAEIEEAARWGNIDALALLPEVRERAARVAAQYAPA